MIQDLTSLDVTANEIDEEVGEDGEEDEDEELSHKDNSKRELRFTLRWRLILLRWAFISRPFAPPRRPHSGMI